MSHALDLLLNLDEHIRALATNPDIGLGLYAILFVIIFCETGLVVMPFLPGDSLLFAAGWVTTVEGSSVDIWPLCGLLILAGVLGDSVNYHIGRYFGPRLLSGRLSRWINPKHIARTQEFFEKYGAKTIVLARFVPIVRTFAPFVAGIGQMRYRTFLTYNVVGAAVWVLSMTWAGYWLGNIQMVKENFEIVVIAIVLLSVLPAVIEYINRRWCRRPAQPVDG
jgi:membrane-associated protein